MHGQRRSRYAALAIMVASAGVEAQGRAPVGAGDVLPVATVRAVPANLVTTDLGALLAGGVTVSYERAFTPSFSVLVGPRFQFGVAPFILGASDQLKRSAGFGVGGELEARVYTFGFAPQGFFLGLRTAVLRQTRTTAGSPSSPGSVPTETYVTHTQIGISLGYQHVFARVFPLTVGLGVSLVLRDAYVEGFYVPMRVAVGFAFD